MIKVFHHPCYKTIDIAYTSNDSITITGRAYDEIKKLFDCKAEKKDEYFGNIKDYLDQSTEFLGYYPEYKELDKSELIEIIKTLNLYLSKIECEVVKGAIV